MTTSEPPIFHYAPPTGPIPILYKDESILVVDKPAGLLSVPGRGEHLSDCLINRLRVEFPDVLLVHRLDLDTSGVLIFARTKPAQGALGKQFEAKTTEKLYIARIARALEASEGLVDLPLIVDWPNRPRHHVNHETGKPAQTKWQVLEQTALETRVALMPLTGRTHQLRVHMAALGHPILGDTLYASGAAMDHPRLMLHAHRLRIDHPDTGAPQWFNAPCPF